MKTRNLPFPSAGRARLVLLAILMGFFPAQAVRADIPSVLTNRIHKGAGVIDLLKDVSSSQLGEYLSANRRMYLGVDLNEHSSGTESARSQGVAIQQMRLVLATTEGDFSFGDFITSTSAKIQDASGNAGEFYTLFGQTGSNELTSGTKGFSIGNFDDVITIDNISFTGEIKSAQLEVAFLKTSPASKAGANEDFFDFSAGFEEFAILTANDAAMLEAAAIGQASAPGGIAFETNTTPLNPGSGAGGGSPDGAGETPGDPSGGGGGTNPAPSAPGAPAPPFVLLLAGAILLALHELRKSRTGALTT